MSKLDEEKLREGAQQMFSKIQVLYDEIAKISEQFKQKMPLNDRAIEIMIEEVGKSNLSDELKLMLVSVYQLLLPTLIDDTTPEGYIT